MFLFFSWVPLALTSALADAFENVAMKHSLTHFDPLIVSWLRVVYATLLIAPFMFLQGVPTVDQEFWLALLTRTVLDSVAIVLYVRALKLTDISLAVPMVALSPVFLVGLEFLVTGDLPSLVGFLGIMLVALGAYLLNRKPGHSVFEPIREIFRDKGVFLMFCVAVIWSLTSLLHRIAIEHSNAMFYAGVGQIALLIAMTPVAIWWNRSGVLSALHPRRFVHAAPAGLFEGISFLVQIIAQSMTLASYVIAVKRTSIAISAFFGKVFFKEKIDGRIFPIILLLLGVFCITLW